MCTGVPESNHQKLSFLTVKRTWSASSRRSQVLHLLLALQWEEVDCLLREPVNQLQHLRSALQWDGVQQRLPICEWKASIFFLHYSGRSLVKILYCVQLDECIYNTFFLHYSGRSKFNIFVLRGTKFNIGFPFASGKSTTPSSCATVGGSTLAKSGTASSTTSSLSTSSPALQW